MSSFPRPAETGIPSVTDRRTALGPVSEFIERHYRHFNDVMVDTIDARVWLGIHFRTADEDGARLGKEVARWVGAHAFVPTE